MRKLLILIAAFTLVADNLAVAQSATPTQTPTSTPTSTSTATRTSAPAVPTFSVSQLSKIQDFSPGAKAARLGATLNALIVDSGASVKLQVVPGIDGSGGGVQNAALYDRAGSIVAVLAVVTSGGAMATKALLAVTTDYVLADDGTLEIASNQAANTLLVFYRRK